MSNCFFKLIITTPAAALLGALLEYLGQCVGSPEVQLQVPGRGLFLVHWLVSF